MAGVQELLDCMISSWYPQFQRVSFKTVIMPLPQPVLDWLVSDGLHLAADTQAFARRGQIDAYADEDEYREWSDSEDGEDAGSGAAAQPAPAELAEVQRQLAQAIEELGGRVVPKLSWSCPKDAVWMSPTSSLCCTNADEVLLLLRSSDRVAHDISSALQEAQQADAAAASTAAVNTAGPAAAEPGGAGSGGDTQEAGPSAAGSAVVVVQHCLAVRRWHGLQAGREFRCFVRGQALAGVCQRDLTQFFEFLLEERRELLAGITAFHEKHVQGRFPQPHYTYDVYVATSGAVRLLDFNPVGGTTAPLLCSWEELGLAGGQEAAGQQAAGQAAEQEAAKKAAGQEAAGAVQVVAAPQGAGQAAAGAVQLAAGHAAAGCGSCCEHEPAGQAAAAEAAAPDVEASYLEQLRRVREFSLAGAAQEVQAGQAGACAGQQADTSAGQRESKQQRRQQVQEVVPQSSSGRPASSVVELRIIEEPVVMRPATLAYGVPFDFVDSSEGSALDRLMQQAQQAGAGEMWQALAAQAAPSGTS